MTRPVPEPVDSKRVRELALSVVAADRFPLLATMDGDQPRLRPVSPVKTDGFTIYVANLKQYHKTIEIAANPRVELSTSILGITRSASRASPKFSPIAPSSKKSGRPIPCSANTWDRSTTLR
jgi:hypothetical protein